MAEFIIGHGLENEAGGVNRRIPLGGDHHLVQRETGLELGRPGEILREQVVRALPGDAREKVRQGAKGRVANIFPE